MKRLAWELPEQLTDAIRRSRSTSLAARTSAAVAVAGMGGSAIGADIIAAVLAESCPVPFRVVRDYRLPAIVGQRTLFFAVSYSGNTEETLAAYEQATKRGCQVVVVTGGGELRRLAERRKQPIFRVPSGLPPRAALGYLLVPLALVLDQVGVARGLTSQLKRAAAFLGKFRAGFWRQARTVARSMKGRLPIVYSTCRLLDPVADRWRCQLNENAKVLCHTGLFPEHNHNEIVGMGSPSQLRRSVIVFLVDKRTHPRTMIRMKQTISIVRGTFERVHRLQTGGSALLERVLSLCMLGDMVSVELARLQGVDPFPVARIDLLKSRMRGGR
ncbi:MAG: bifunctional phosphoglucose/phosphomannose isomerase [candidate division WOR-3 bacterium]